MGSVTVRILPALALAFGASAYTGTAMADASRCGDRERMVAHLANKYKEQPTAIGLQNDGQILEIFSSKASGTWTILVSRPNGVSCVAISGEGWQAMQSPESALPADPGA